MSKRVLIAALTLTTVSTFVCAEQGDNYAPPNYSPYQAEQYLLPQSRDELVAPYSPLTPNVQPPQYKRPYAVLPPSYNSGNNYGYYNSAPYQRGGYPYYGNQSGNAMAMPWGSLPGAAAPWGGSSFGSSPWGGSPWGNSFNWMSAPGMMPFGW